MQLNTKKTETLIVAAEKTATKVATFMGSLKDNIRPHLRNLGVIFDQTMQLDNHVKSLTRTCSFTSEILQSSAPSYHTLS